MNHLLLVDTQWASLLPLTYTRPVSQLRLGIYTIEEKWRHSMKLTISYHTRDYLQHAYPKVLGEQNLCVNSSILPCNSLVVAIQQLELGQSLYTKDGVWIAAVLTKNQCQNPLEPLSDNAVDKSLYAGVVRQIVRPFDLFKWNEWSLLQDFEIAQNGRVSSGNIEGSTVFGGQLFVEEGAEVRGAIVDATLPVYIGRNVKVLPGASIMGPVAIEEGTVVKMGAKIYGKTTIGPYCKVGGEINNSILLGYSNKGHDGYLGNSVLGEWCNLGADTNVSNLKNNYSEIRLWDYPAEQFVPTGLTFCGMIMGDHSKCGINTMFNSGTVVGVFANVFGAGFQRNFIPSFGWGGPKGMRTYRLDKALEVAEIVMGRRGVELSSCMRDILTSIFNLSSTYRHDAK